MRKNFSPVAKVIPLAEDQEKLNEEWKADFNNLVNNCNLLKTRFFFNVMTFNFKKKRANF